jgi:hypothetical protein
VIAVPAAPTPYWWWSATTPCTSVYLPVAAVGADLPAGLSLAGGAAGAGPNPEQAAADTPDEASYWWRFQLLLEAVCRDDNGTGYSERQPRVRSVFDPLQQEFRTAAAGLEQTGAGPEQWDALTIQCALAARDAAEALLQEFDRADD